MKVLIEIDEEYLDIVRGAKAHGADFKPYNIIANGTPLNGTNGEVLKAVFPNVESRLDEKTGIMLVKWTDNTTKCFKASWWNADYKG